MSLSAHGREAVQQPLPRALVGLGRPRGSPWPVALGVTEKVLGRQVSQSLDRREKLSLFLTGLLCTLNRCDWNRYNIQYALAVSKQRGLKRPSEPLGSDEEADASDDDSLHLLGTGQGDGDGQLV